MYVENTWIKKHCVAKSHVWVLVSKTAWLAGPGLWSAPCIWRWWCPNLILYIVLGPSLQERLEVLEEFQRRETRLVKGLEHRSYVEWLRKPRVFSLEKRSQRGALLSTATWWEVVARWRSASAPRQSVTGQEEIAPCCDRRSFDWILGKISPWK